MSASVAMLLQLGDSSFPSGAFTASWGLEGLVASGIVSDEDDVTRVVEEHVRHRWATFDRVVAHLVAQALGEGAGLDRIVAIDDEVELMSLPPAQRAASRAAGGAFVRSAAEVLGAPFADDQRRLDATSTSLHLAVAHTFVLLSAGIPLADVEVSGGMQLVQQLAGAAVRLGVLGHLGAQRVISAGRRAVLAIVAVAPVDLRPAQFTPRADVAMYLHPTLPTRLFRC
jgi:urease accessory protein